MSSSTHDDLGEKILADLARLTADKRARGEAEEPGYEPLPASKRAAIIDRLLGPESDDGSDDGAPPTDGEANACTPGSKVTEADDPNVTDDPNIPGDPNVAGDPKATKAAARADDASDNVVPLVEVGPEAATNDRRWLLHAGGYLATAAAAAAVVALVLPRESVEGESGDPPEAAVARPAFESWRIDGGGPPPEHLGKSEGRLVCPNNPLQLTLAVAPDHTLDPTQPLQLIVQATPSEGPGHRVIIDLVDDERFEWRGDRALVYRGTLRQLVPLAPGQWVLEPSVGAPGACTGEPREACTMLDARTIEIGDRDRCDGKE